VKVFIVSDMEGVAGIVKWEQTDGTKEKRAYHEGRELYTEEELKFNGVSVGETGINAALCGHWECPVLLVTGDDAVCREATELLGEGLTTVSVKKGLGRFSARQVPPLRAREMIEDGARRVLQDLSAVKPYDPGRPCEIRIEFTTPAKSHGADPSESGYTSRRPRSRTVSIIRSASAVVVLQLTKAGRKPTVPAQRVVPT